MITEPDLFDFAARSGPAPAAEPSPTVVAIGSVHWLVVTTRQARTGCGIFVTDYDFEAHIGIGPEGRRINCSLDGFSDRVTCLACKEAL